jgi:hypothetical protein
MNTNLLDLNNDVLNTIGDYVKRDNNERIQDYNFIYYVITEHLASVDCGAACTSWRNPHPRGGAYHRMSQNIIN